MDERTNETNEAPAVRETMTMGEAARELGISVSRVRRMCRMHSRNPATGLAFAWSSDEVRTTTQGHERRGKRLPYVDAVREYARLRAEAERDHPETMAIGEAAGILGLPVEKVRDLCDAGELPFAWTYGEMPHPDVAGRMLRGHRRPYVAAVRHLAERLRQESSG